VLLVALAITLVGHGPMAAQGPSAGPSPSAPSPAPTVLPVAPSWFVDPAWSRLSVDGGPAAREDATWTVDADATSGYLFGGRDGATVFDDLWRFDLDMDTWSRLRPPGGPSARFGHSAAWVDEAGLVVFGGQRGTDFFDDLWAYDPERDRWTRLPRRGQAPAARYGTCAIVDADGRFVISHGFTFKGRFDDTRAYDFERERWASTGPDGRRPGERCLHDCFLDAGGRLVLYGGQDNGARALGDLWLSHVDRWARQPDPPPVARRLYAVATAGSDAWIFGGAARDDRVLDDLWRVDREALTFTRVRPAGPTPAARSGAVMVADPSRQRILLFGGEARDALDDLWQLRDASAIDTSGTTSEPTQDP
jgi:Galactose oxidase, central domain